MENKVLRLFILLYILFSISGCSQNFDFKYSFEYFVNKETEELLDNKIDCSIGHNLYYLSREIINQ